jgi:hypothetical protein
MPLISGLGTWAATGDFKKGLMSGLLGAGIGGIAGALGSAAGAGKAALDATNLATNASTLANVGKGTADVASLVKGGADIAQGAGAVAQGIPGMAAAGSSGIQAIGQGANAMGQNGNVLRMGAEFLRNKPVTSGLLLSSLMSAGMTPTPEGSEPKKGERFADEGRVVDRHTLPFTGGPPPGPSTYVRGEQFTPDNPYRYGQYEGEKMFFDGPGLERGANGDLPPLPGPSDSGPGGGGGGIMGVRDYILKRKATGGKISGPGDGQSDNIPATGPGMDILLSDGEFVIPADVVSALGAGSTDAGAKRLESAMSKIRTTAYGSSKQARRPGRISL